MVLKLEGTSEKKKPTLYMKGFLVLTVSNGARTPLFFALRTLILSWLVA